MKIPKLKSREDFPILIRHMGYKKICEVGVHKGRFLTYLASSKPDYLVGVDVWDKYDKEAYKNIPCYYKFFPHEQNKIWRKNVQSWAERVSFKTDIIVDFSVEAAKQFEDDYFDFIYIDADHTYDGVTADLEAWYPKVRKGGMIAGHDYINGHLNHDKNYEIVRCKDGIDDFVKKYGIEKDFVLTEQKGDFYFIKS